jgi:hypothetical protein
VGVPSLRVTAAGVRVGLLWYPLLPRGYYGFGRGRADLPCVEAADAAQAIAYRMRSA